MVLLQAAGYPCHAVSLPSPQHIDSDTRAIRSTILSYAEQGKEIVLVSHSASGSSSCNSLEDLDVLSRTKSGKTGGVRAIAIISGFLLPNDFRFGPESQVPGITSDWWRIDVRVAGYFILELYIFIDRRTGMASSIRMIQGTFSTMI